MATEKSLLRSNDPGYTFYVVNVPKSLEFIDKSPTDMLFPRFDHIFEMYCMSRLDFMFIRLFALHLIYMVKKEKISKITPVLLL